MRFRIAFRFLLLVCAALLAAQATFVYGQEAVSQQKRTAIRKLIEVSEMPQRTFGLFETLMTLYQQQWTANVIADLKAKGHFKRLTPAQAAKLEKVVEQFGSDVYGNIKKRMREEIFTLDSWENASGPIFEKYLTADEINELITFAQASSGKRMIENYYKAMIEAMVLTLTEKGVFNVQSSPEAEEAKLERLKKLSEKNPSEEIQVIISRAQALTAATLTESEWQEWHALGQRPLAIKLAQIMPHMGAEVRVNMMRLYGPQVQKLTQEVINEQLNILPDRLREAAK